MGVEAIAIDHQPYGKDAQSREAHEREMDAELRARGVEIVCLAGYMRVLTPWFVHAWSGRLLNIHPSLLPDFPGLDTHRRALESGHTEAGCTVHLVTEGVDEGPILGQARVRVLPGDTPESLAARVVVAEDTTSIRQRLRGSCAKGHRRTRRSVPDDPFLDVEFMMAQLMVLYGKPADAAAVDKHYADVHAPLAKAIPGLRKFELSHGGVGTPQGPSNYHLIATLHFDDVAAIQAAFASPEGQAAAGDLSNFASGSAELLIFDTRPA